MSPDAAYYDDMRFSPEVIDPPKNEEMVEVSELVNDHVQHSPKTNLSDANSVRELLECPVCLNAMYPPIHQVWFYTFLFFACSFTCGRSITKIS